VFNIKRKVVSCEDSKPCGLQEVGLPHETLRNAVLHSVRKETPLFLSSAYE